MNKRGTGRSRQRGRFQILALSGGGFLGLYAAKLLASLEERAGRPLGRCFDLICGTSIGGIMTLGLGAEVSAERILTAFETSGQKIFSKRPRPPASGPAAALDLARSVFKPKYTGAGLRETLVSLLGDQRLSASRHRLVIPAVNMTKGHIQVFKTGHHKTYVIDHRRKMVDIGMATAAAPTYFPLAEVGDALFADGGLFANAPDLCGLHEATCFLGRPAEEVHILSIGTTTSKFSLAHVGGVDLGGAQWLSGGRLFATMISAQQQLAHAMLSQQMGDRYLRIDSTPSAEQQSALGLDVATAAAQRTLRGLAEAAFQEVATSPALTAFLEHEPSPPIFDNR
jgi:patatin-like phospholipase/acyl hydrolase